MKRKKEIVSPDQRRRDLLGRGGSGMTMTEGDEEDEWWWW